MEPVEYPTGEFCEAEDKGKVRICRQRWGLGGTWLFRADHQTQQITFYRKF